MATILMLDLPLPQAGDAAAARAAAVADMARSQAQGRAEMAQARAEAMRAQVEARVAQAEAVRAQAEAARAQAEAARAGKGVIMLNPRGPAGPSRREQAMFFTGFIVFVFAAVVILHPIARALARRLEGGGKREARLDADSSAQLQRIEHTVEAMAIEIERLSEGQRFTTKLLASRAEAESLIPRR